MAFAVNDRVKETSTTTGTGTFTLAGAVEGFDTFLSAIGNTNTTYYAITNQSVPTEFEVGIGTVVSGTLTRDTVISSSNSDAVVTFSSGEKNVFCTLPASKAVLENDLGVASATTFSGSGANLTNLNASNVASGTLDNARLDAELAAIGGLTSAADKGIQFTGSGTAGTFDLTTAGKALLDDADAAAQRTTLGLGSIAQLNTVTLTTNTTGDYVASITAGEGITGAASGEGSTPTLAIDLNELTTSTSDTDGDFFAVVDSVGAQKKLTKANIAISGFNNDSGFIDGSSLNASNLSSGTVPDARFPATLPAANGSALTDLNASNLASGTVPIARIDLNLLTTSTADADGDFFAVVDSVGAEKKLTKANINISGFNNDSGFIDGTSLNASNLDSGTVPDARFPATLPAASGVNLTSLNASNVASGTLSADRLPTVPTTKGGTGLTTIGTANQVLAVNSGGTALEYQTPTTGDITAVTAGSGLTGGGTTGDVTLNVGAGTGIDVAADTVAVDVSDFMTNGVNNRVLTATGTDAMNAEANMTFDGSTLTVTGTISATTYSGGGASITNRGISTILAMVFG
jgi:hypothetical protein